MSIQCNARYWLLLIGLLLLSGCASTGLSPLSYGVRHVPPDDIAFVLDVAAEAMIESGYEVERVDPAAGTVVAKPVRTTGSYEGLPRETRLSTPARLRRIALIHVVPEAEGGTGVYCQVTIQQQTTEAYRMFQQDRELSDAPGQTAIERDAATTTEQNTVWRNVRRDKAAERRILEAVVRRTEQVGP